MNILRVKRNATQRNATQRNATQRNATQRNATQRNATQRNATQRKLLLCLSLSNSYIKIFEKSKPAYEIFS